eukprot:2362335-Rhodomonas_salina.1
MLSMPDRFKPGFHQPQHLPVLPAPIGGLLAPIGGLSACTPVFVLPRRIPGLSAWAVCGTEVACGAAMRV